MESEYETRALDGVIDRLAERFPHIPRTNIARAVREEHEGFDGSPVRDYIPVLIEHAAKQRLRTTVPAERHALA
ncbi:three-helix bundle dimerization domain-containing protein [Cryobacterium sp. MDB2-10]|uniref:three-helix bundle dimerization domain-containing protein n=1 Tax=Cryobacterium sp. MDB2-10 TaxID=1259177 RepID=UPI0010739871|nr:hypothetical protein [Cryobacterium sp. MDB2-10]TFC12522.1 hypothetical protein E3O51_18275 [Cryobacterium sp. MDB2-10]